MFGGFSGLDRDAGDHLVDAVQGFRGECDADGAHVVGDLLGAGHADDGGCNFRPAQDPGQGHLRHGEAEVGGDGLELCDGLEKIVGAEVAACGLHEDIHLVVGGAGAGRRRLAWRVFSGEYAMCKRREGEVADGVARASGKDGGFWLAPEH